MTQESISVFGEFVGWFAGAPWRRRARSRGRVDHGGNMISLRCRRRSGGDVLVYFLFSVDSDGCTVVTVAAAARP
uniref:Uncharacterized protein n=1 Tax=Triticum urartu TaxID=4572 RepID=A0A8R7UNY2_TRIUA